MQAPLLEQLMPVHDFGETHLRKIAAPPERVEEAIRSVTPAEMPLARLLMALRGISRRTGPAGRPFLDGMGEIGFSEIGERRGREVVFGGIGQPWRLGGGESVPVQGPGPFTGFSRDGFVKMAIDFRLEPAGEGTRLETNTWVAATDPASRRRFRRYWLAIRTGSGLIRRELLGAIAKRAEGTLMPSGGAREEAGER